MISFSSRPCQEILLWNDSLGILILQISGHTPGVNSAFSSQLTWQSGIVNLVSSMHYQRETISSILSVN